MSLSNSQFRNLRKLIGAVRIVGLKSGDFYVGESLLATDLGTYGTVRLTGRLEGELGSDQPTALLVITKDADIFIGQPPCLEYEKDELRKLIEVICPGGENPRLLQVVLDLSVSDILRRVAWPLSIPRSDYRQAIAKDLIGNRI